MGLQNLPCSRCSARTGQLTLLVQLFSPRRWEGIFTVCLSCLQASQHSQRYALNEVRQTIYRARPGVGRPTLNLEDIVLRHLARVGPSKAGAVQRELGKNGIRLNDHETAELLRRMEFKGLLEKKEVSWAERVLKELLASKKAAGKPCPVCGND